MHYSGARFMASAITTLAGVIDLHHDLLVDALCRLAECQIHDVLQKRKKNQCFELTIPSQHFAYHVE